MRTQRGRRNSLLVRPEINVTSLVDVAFTLLVIFIITAPVLQGGVEVNLPQGQVGTVQVSDEMLIVSIQQDGSAYVGETLLPAEGMEGALRQLIQAGSVQMVYVKGDSLALYGPVFRVVTIAAMQEGIGVSLIGREIRR